MPNKVVHQNGLSASQPLVNEEAAYLHVVHDSIEEGKQHNPDPASLRTIDRSDTVNLDENLCEKLIQPPYKNVEEQKAVSSLGDAAENATEPEPLYDNVEEDTDVHDHELPFDEQQSCGALEESAELEDQQRLMDLMEKGDEELGAYANLKSLEQNKLEDVNN